MSEKKVTKREQVKQLIEKGEMTKAQIAEELGMSAASVSSQMTYIRWMGMFIATNTDGILTFCTEEEAEALKAERAAKTKTKKVSNKTPEEQAATLAKTLKTQTKSVENWTKKASTAEAALESSPDDEDLQDLRDEAEANLTILRIKIKRNEIKADDLPDAVEAEAVDEDEDEDELL